MISGHDITHLGGNPTIQLYGNLQGVSLLYCIVWVGNVMTPVDWSIDQNLMFVVLLLGCGKLLCFCSDAVFIVYDL